MRFPWLALSIALMRIQRDSAWLLAALLFAAAALPLLVYYTGLYTFGPYAGGGSLDFVRNYYADLAGLRPAAWLLLLGPVILALLWRVVVAYAWPRAGQ